MNNNNYYAKSNVQNKNSVCYSYQFYPFLSLCVITSYGNEFSNHMLGGIWLLSHIIVYHIVNSTFHITPVFNSDIVSCEISENFHLSIATDIFDVHGSTSSATLNFLPSLELDTQHSSPVQVSDRWQDAVEGSVARLVLYGQAKKLINSVINRTDINSNL